MNNKKHLTFTKYLLLLLFFASFVLQSSAQHEGSIICTSDKAIINLDKLPKLTSKLTACAPDEITYLRINVHFFLRNQSLPGAPGNFTETDDGLGSPAVTGYSIADDLIRNLNYQMTRNYQANLYPGMNDIPPAAPPTALAKQIQFIHTGTYFHRVSDVIYSSFNGSSTSWSIPGDFGVNLDTELNIYMMERGIVSNQGLAITNPAQAGMYLGNAWASYHVGNNMHDYARTAGHEIGHILGLNHSWECTNPCSGNDIDQPLETCGVGCDLCYFSGGNNLMSTVPVPNALTPCQLSIALGNLPVLANYVEFCCDDWTIVPTTNIPGIKMIPYCNVADPCFEFDIINYKKGCSPPFTGGTPGEDKALLAPFTCFELTGIGAGSTCNEWTFSQIDPTTGLTVATQIFSNTDIVTFFPDGPPGHHIEVCVKLCDLDCEPFTKCVLFESPIYIPLGEGSGSSDRSNTSAEQSPEVLLSLYPNPVKEILSVDFPITQVSSVYISDQLGRQVLQANPANALKNGIRLEGLAPGSYFLTIETIDQGSKSLKFVKVE